MALQGGTGKALTETRPGPPGVTRRTRRSRIASLFQRHLKWLLASPALLVIAVLAAWPLLVLLVVALTWYGDVASRPTFAGLRNFSDFLGDPAARHSLAVTARLAALMVAIEFLLGMTLAFAMVKRFRGRAVVMAVLIVPLFISPAAVGQSWRFLLEPLYAPTRDVVSRIAGQGASNSVLTDTTWRLMELVVADVWQWTPFMFVVLLAGLAAVPKRALEMAELDGIGRWRRFSSVTLPHIAPLILLALAIRLLDALRLFDIVAVMTSGGPGVSTSTASFYLYATGIEQLQQSRAAAGSLIFLLPVGAMILFVARRLSRVGPA